MTDEEIKLELAKAMLANANFLPKEDTVEMLYAWVSGVNPEDKRKQKEPISTILEHVAQGGSANSMCHSLLSSVFLSNGIDTVADLLKIGRRMFRAYKGVGRESLALVDKALKELYGIKNW